jgi:hypothetical protein
MARTRAAVLRAAAQNPLEGMRVAINQAGQDGAPAEPQGFGEISRLTGKSSDAASGVRKHRKAGLKSFAGVDQVRQPTDL